jgi:hypothetical protein
MENFMSSVRTKHDKNNPYVTLNKGALEDKNLSWAAKGLWAYLLSRPDNWHVSVSHLCKIYDDRGGGEKSIYAYLKELITHGYCERVQEKLPNGTWGQYEYVVHELKECLPNSLQGDAVQRVAVNLPLLSNDCLPSNEKKTTTAPAAVAVFSCLSGLAISEKEKIALCKKHSEAELIQAVAVVTHSTFKLNTTLIQAIRWALKEKPEIPKAPKEIAGENGKYAFELIANKKKIHSIQIDILSKGVEIVFQGCQKEPDFISFTDKDFKNRLNKYFILA